MTHHERAQIRHSATSAIEEACHTIINNLGILSQCGAVDCDSVSENGVITFRYQDLSRLKEIRQRLGLPDESAASSGHRQAPECQMSLNKENQRVWELQIGMPHLGSLYKFDISLQDGAIEDPIGLESDTLPAQSQL